MADEAYSDTGEREKPGTTVEILADEISKFGETVNNSAEEHEFFALNFTCNTLKVVCEFTFPAT
jgi:hypothetical protein